MKKTLIFLNLVCFLFNFFLWIIFYKTGFVEIIFEYTSLFIQLLVIMFLFSNNRFLTCVLLPFIFYYGVGGLITLDFSSEGIPLQITNIILSLTLVYIVLSHIIRIRIIRLIIGVTTGLFLFFIFRYFQINHF